MNDLLPRAAERVAAKRRELEQRLADLHKAHPFEKLAAARLVASALFELLDHQTEVNVAAIARIETLEARVRELEARAAIVQHQAAT